MSIRADSHIQFIRTPRYLWPFNSEFSAFWPPLGFCSLAAALRERFRELRLSVLDCPALQVGWRGLECRLRSEPPDVVCIGEETVSSREGRRLARLARVINPDCVIIAGGVYFSYAVEETFAEGDVDFIVCGEGEETLAELIGSLLNGLKDPGAIRGLAWRDGRKARINPPRPLIADLDSLPMPAYDLLRVEAYGARARNHPHLASLEHSRGCIDRCSFCILWKHFGDWNNGSVTPCYRTKSPERTVEEVAWLARDYGRRTINFVDPTFNADAAWSDRFAELMLRANLPVRFTAWMRADGIVRDERLGVLDKLVRAGLVEVYLGVERVEDGDLARLRKHHCGPETTRRALEILRTRYPQVFTIGTVIYGMPWENKESLRRLREFHYEAPADYVFHIPLAPNPGTDLRAELLAKGYRMSGNFREYNFFTPVMDTDHLTRRELENFYSGMLLSLSPKRFRSLWRSLRRKRGRRYSRVERNLLFYAAKVGLRQLWRRLLGPLAKGPTLHARKPKWYES